MPEGEVSVPAQPTWRRMLPWALCVLPVAIFAIQAWDHRWILDDGFINFRIVRQIEAGNGPVYNAGQRVEAFTSPLWIVVLTIVDLLTPIRLEWISVVFGIGFAVAGLGFAVAGSARLWHVIAKPSNLAPFGILVPLALYPMWYFASSGLETGTIFGWMGLSMFVLGRWARAERESLSPWAGCLLGLGWLIRPELVLVSLALLLAVIIGQGIRPWRRTIVLLLAAFVLPALYQLFRMGYYASLVSNTAYAKKATTANWSRGAVYLREFGGDYALWIPLLALLLAGYVPIARALRTQPHRRAAIVALAFPVGGALVALYVVRVGGDYIHARLLLPPLFAVLVPVALLPFRARTFGAIAVAVVVPWAIVSALWLRPQQRYQVTLDKRENLITVEDVIEEPAVRVADNYYDGRIFWEQKRLRYAPNPKLVRKTGGLAFIGTTGFIVGPHVDILDTLGLSDALDARFQTTGGTSIAGHEKPMPAAWAAARLTAPEARPQSSSFPVRGFGFVIDPLIPVTEGKEFQRQVTQVRRALQCGELKQFQDAYTKPLTLGRFFGNVGRSFTTFGFSIPPDPDTAVRTFCGAAVVGRAR
ncbi:MAG: hypothetical protein JJE46_01730 [Acidimicrobiia bacterium]|nr:hypothetical protein [Acidimicrobiia bacterium]